MHLYPQINTHSAREIGIRVPVQTEIRDSAPSNRNCWRAPPEPEYRRKKDPGVFFICTKGGRGGAGPDPHTNHSRNFRLEDPPQFFGQIFWEKILEIKIVLLASPRRGVTCRPILTAPRSDSGPGSHSLARAATWALPAMDRWHGAVRACQRIHQLQRDKRQLDDAPIIAAHQTASEPVTSWTRIGPHQPLGQHLGPGQALHSAFR